MNIVEIWASVLIWNQFWQKVTREKAKSKGHFEVLVNISAKIELALTKITGSYGIRTNCKIIAAITLNCVCCFIWTPISSSREIIDVISVRFGTFFKATHSSVRRHAESWIKAAFLEPSIGIVPDSFCPPEIVILLNSLIFVTPEQKSEQLGAILKVWTQWGGVKKALKVRSLCIVNVYVICTV